jgi:hypothetical protein
MVNWAKGVPVDVHNIAVRFAPMKASVLAGTLLRSLVLFLPFSAIAQPVLRATEKVTITFDDLKVQSGYLIPTNTALQRVYFEGVWIEIPAIINTFQGPLNVATSGRAMASTTGAKMRFSMPVFQITMNVAPPILFADPHKERGFLTAFLKAYTERGDLITTATTGVITATSDENEILNFTPTIISVSSATPIASATLDFDDPWRADGTRLMFDDLTLTIAASTKPPALTIQADDGRVTVRRNALGNVQKSPDLRNWHSFSESGEGPLTLDPQTDEMMFFRLLP